MDFSPRPGAAESNGASVSLVHGVAHAIARAALRRKPDATRKSYADPARARAIWQMFGYAVAVAISGRSARREPPYAWANNPGRHSPEGLVSAIALWEPL